MTVTVEFFRKGRIAHTRNFEIDDISEFLDRLNSRFCEYHLIANEIDVCGEESDLYDQFMHQSTWYAYTGRIVYIKNLYAAYWCNEYADTENNNNTILV